MSPIEELFPNLSDSEFRITSPRSTRYNCIAWAAGDTERWWEPGEEYHWPAGVLREYSLEAYVEAFRALGYEPCESASLEPGFEVVALFASETGSPTHAARRLPSGDWTSKLGQLEDIEHRLDDLAGAVYGRVACLLKRPRLESEAAERLDAQRPPEAHDETQETNA